MNPVIRLSVIHNIDMQLESVKYLLIVDYKDNFCSNL